MSTNYRLTAALLVCTATLWVAGCSMPHVMGMGSYYAVTDQDTGQVYYTNKVSREKRGAVEFQDRKSGAWISLKSASVRKISQDEFKRGPSAVDVDQ